MKDIRERTFRWADPRRSAKLMASLDGLALVNAIKNGTLPAPPSASMLGMAMDEVGDGRVVFSMQAEEWMCNPAVVVHGGIVATLLDTVLTLAVLTKLSRGKSALTVNMNIHYVRPLMPTGERIMAEGLVVHVGKTLGTAEGRVHNAGGKLIAHGTATIAILDIEVPQ